MRQAQTVKKTTGNASKFGLHALIMLHEWFAFFFSRYLEDSGNFYDNEQRSKQCLVVARTQLLQEFITGIHAMLSENLVCAVTNGGLWDTQACIICQ